MVLKLANIFSATTDLPRTRVVIVMALFSGINFVTILSVLSSVLQKKTIIDSKIYTIVGVAAIVTLNFLAVFYKQRYKKVEACLSVSWDKEKNKSILITAAYLLATIIFIWMAILCFKHNVPGN